MAKNDTKKMAKDAGLAVLMGSGVFIVTPILAGVMPDLGFLAFEIIPGVINVSQAVSAGIAAFGMDFAISKWLR